MKLIFIYIAALVLLCACNKQTATQPQWVNATDTLRLPEAQLEFTSTSNDWKATLLTPTQPIQLLCSFTNGKLQVSLLHKKGITEGPATVCLYQGKQFYFYPVYLLNEDTAAVISREYRSPKTVNPDSSLLQQRMVHSYDVYRNILPAQQNHGYFFEEEKRLAPKAGVYRAVQKDALSAYYIQAGSCTGIPVKAMYKKETDSYYVTAGPLKDSYNNTVADGTLVVFIYSDNVQTHHMEAALLGGYAGVNIPAEGNKKFILKAKVNETISNSIQLKP